jgi:hypothetical protein
VFSLARPYCRARDSADRVVRVVVQMGAERGSGCYCVSIQRTRASTISTKAEKLRSTTGCAAPVKCQRGSAGAPTGLARRGRPVGTSIECSQTCLRVTNPVPATNNEAR